MLHEKSRISDRPEGLYVQISFSEKETFDKESRRVKKVRLNDLFPSKNGWTIQSVEDSIHQFKLDAPMGTRVQSYLSIIRTNANI
jgi:hypothetical protein